MTCTIRLIDPKTGTSTSFTSPSAEDALVLVAETFDKHIIITDDDTGVEVANILPVDDSVNPDYVRAMQREFPT